MNEAKILLHFGTVDPDPTVRFNNITKACKIIADILPNIEENYQIQDNMKELLPKLIKNLDILKSPITRLLKCFIEFYCKEELCTAFFINFATEFHERETEEDKQEMLAFIFEIIKNIPKDDLNRSDILSLIREFIMSKYFTQKRDKRGLIQQVMQMVYDRIGRFIPLEENMEYLKLKGDKVVLKKEDSEDSLSDPGGYEFAGDEVEIKAQIQLFNKSLKEEKMVERLEKWINEGSLKLKQNAKLFEYLKRPEYLHLLASLIGKPNQYQCSVTWMSKMGLDIAEPLLLENYKKYTLPNRNELFSYDFGRLGQIDYINMHSELRNIYRSWMCTKIITNSENAKCMFSAGIKPEIYIETVIEETKEGIKKSSGSNVEHFLSVVYFFLKTDYKATIKALQKYAVLKMCSDIIENPLIQQFISTILFPSECDYEIEYSIVKDAISSKLFKILTNVVGFTRKAMDFDAFEAYHKASIDNPAMTHTSNSESHLSLTIAETVCTESYALAAFDTLFWTVAVLIDSQCSAKEEYKEYKHTDSCYSKEIFLDYLFGDELDTFNCFFSIFIDKLMDENYCNLAKQCGVAVNYILHFGNRALPKQEKAINAVIKRYFLSLERLIVELYSNSLKTVSGSQNEEAKGPSKSKTKIPEANLNTGCALLETLVTICTRYNTKYMLEISRATWATLIQYFLKVRSNPIFQMQFLRLVLSGFEMEDESLVLSIVLFENVIGELWEIVQEKERFQTLPARLRPAKELFYSISTKIILLLEKIEGNPKYPIMNSQFTVNLAWKKIKEVRNRGKEPPVVTNISNKIAAAMKANPVPVKISRRSTMSLHNLQSKRSTTAGSGIDWGTRRSSRDSQRLSSGRSSTRKIG